MVSDRPQAAPWNRLRAWIDQQEAWEKENGAAAELSQRELQAIYDLIPAIAEPDLGREDHISLLNQQMQSKQLPRIVWNDHPINKETAEGFSKQMWRSVCTVGDGKFPRAGFGFARGQEAPCFQNKKKARQFAAKQALKSLSSTSSFSSYNESSGGGPSPPQSRPSSRGAASGRDSPVAEASATRPSPIASPSSKRPKVEDADDGDTPHVFERFKMASPTSSSLHSEKDKAAEARIFWLTGRLNLDPPQYHIEPDSVGNLFRGTLRLRASYKKTSFSPVEGMPDRQAARNKLNEQLLSWLEKEYQDRKDVLDFILKDPSQ